MSWRFLQSFKQEVFFLMLNISVTVMIRPILKGSVSGIGSRRGSRDEQGDEEKPNKERQTQPPRKH